MASYSTALPCVSFHGLCNKASVKTGAYKEITAYAEFWGKEKDGSIEEKNSDSLVSIYYNKDYAVQKITNSNELFKHGTDGTRAYLKTIRVTINIEPLFED